jgi:hypothetical protein
MSRRGSPALIGYEWTSNNLGNSQHRVVIFRDGKDKADQIVPFSAFDSENPAMLWKFLDAYQAKTRPLSPEDLT